MDALRIMEAAVMCLTTSMQMATIILSAKATQCGVVSMKVTLHLSQAQLDAINSYLNVTGGAVSALALLSQDGFTEATAGPVLGYVSYGAFNYTNTVYLPGAPTSVTGTMALVGKAVGGAYDGWMGVIAFSGQNSGGDPNALPPGVPATLSGWNNMSTPLCLVLSVPEPTTLAMLALGGLFSLWLFRRRK